MAMGGRTQPAFVILRASHASPLSGNFRKRRCRPVVAVTGRSCSGALVPVAMQRYGGQALGAVSTGLWIGAWTGRNAC